MQYLRKVIASILCIILLIGTIDLSGISGLIVKAANGSVASTDYITIQWSTRW